MEGYAECEVCGYFRSGELPDDIRSGEKVVWFCDNCRHDSGFIFEDERYPPGE